MRVCVGDDGANSVCCWLWWGTCWAWRFEAVYSHTCPPGLLVVLGLSFGLVSLCVAWGLELRCVCVGTPAAVVLARRVFFYCDYFELRGMVMFVFCVHHLHQQIGK